MIELGRELAHQHAEAGALDEFERVRRRGARGQHKQAGDGGNGLDRTLIGAPRQDARQPRAVVELEDLVLARAAQVGIDEQCAPAQLGQHDGQVGDAEAAAVGDVGADDG